MKDSYHTPLVLRTGILHSYKRTLLAGAINISGTAFCFVGAGVLMQALADPWFYSVPIALILGVFMVRGIIAGYDETFSIFDTEFEASRRIYCSLSRSPSYAHNRIANLFLDNEQYERFREDLRKNLFSSREYVLFILVTPLLVAISYGYVILGNPIQVSGLYGSFVEPYITIWGYWLVLSYFFWGYFIVSILWMVISMILSISIIEAHRPSFKVTEYVKFIRENQPLKPESVMGYEAFYSLTAPVGQFLYNVTFKVMLVVVALVLYMLSATILQIHESSVYGTALAVGCVVTTLLLFLWSQLGLHNILARTKNQVRDALAMRRDELNNEMIGWINTRDGYQDKEIVNRIYFQKTALERLEHLGDIVEHGQTWSFRMPTALKLIGASMTPLLVAIGQYLLEHYQIIP